MSESAEEVFRREAGGLGVEEILALCYSLRQSAQPSGRLRLYLDILRHRGGERAQFASCLICFDLARGGDITAQKEFAFLADVVRSLADNQVMVDNLVGDDAYLGYVWELCKAQLAEDDPRFVEVEVAAAEAPLAASVDLLSDEDFTDSLVDFGSGLDGQVMRSRFDAALDVFLGGVPGMPVFDSESGFRLHSSRDSERIETFLRELDSVRDFVRISRGFRALLLLFYGTHIRSKNIFGVVNARKQTLLHAGLEEFQKSGDVIPDVVGVLSPLHADFDAWEKISDVLTDYVAYCAEHPECGIKVQGYDAVGRLIERDQIRGRWRR